MMNRKGYDPRMVDVWCLGVTLYAMSMGKLPFYDEDSSIQSENIKRIQYKVVKEADLNEVFEAIFCPVSSRIDLEKFKELNFFKSYAEVSANWLTKDAQTDAIDY